ncbi:MAG TPA: aminotransferase class V-fold PLP-dependent enzyme [Solirubrobacteraceae bacterium]|nr:aminotransferase class V-fold PLP-dependent enzyme [Solirubrobacteraceae bacterium]
MQTKPVLTIAEARDQWSPEGVYLNTASYGLPPRDGFDAVQQALADWRGGRTSWEHWGESTEGARAAFAAMVGVTPQRVAIGATVSEFVGLAAACLPAGARVIVPDVEFTSTLFPFLVQEQRGVSVTMVAPSQLAEAIDARTDVVAFSAVQMSTGEVADIDAIVAAAAHHGALTLLDATQACGWLPVDATRFGAVVCSAYKWLMSPRGTSFMVVDDEWLERIVPHSAGWYAGSDVHASYFGPPLRLATDARRLDTSPAWFSWVGTQPALELLNRIGVGTVYAHDVALANRFRDGLGMQASNSAIVSADIPDGAERLRRAGIVAALRGGRLRASWHVYNTDADVDAALDALSP